jgi:hypothetical protein
MQQQGDTASQAPRLSGVLGVLITLTLTTGCTGQVLDPEAPAPGSTGSDPGGNSPGGSPAGPGAATPSAPGAPSGPAATPAAPSVCKPAADPGPTPIFKLSTVQYRNTVRDLLAASGVAAAADEVRPALAAIPDDSTATFRGMDNRVFADHVQGEFNVASAVADALTTRPERLTAVAGPCALVPPLAGKCVDDFLATFGRRALRRPLAPAELASYRALNDGQRAAAEVFRSLIVLLLTSPRFLNHLEIEGTPVGGREDLLALGPYEIAARLSYTFWQTMPDEPLFAAAAATGADALTTDAGFSKQLDRVFADPRTRQTVWQFWNEWLRLESFTGFVTARPGWKALAAGEMVGAAGHDDYGDMVQELRDLTELFTWSRRGSLDDLLSTDLSVTRSPALAGLYQVAPWSGSGDYPHLPRGRGGILQRAALLVSSLETTNPFHRGAFVRRTLLCDDLPQPDPTTLPPGSLDPPPPSSAETTRARFAHKTESALCQGCHGRFNELGFVLEGYDALGRARTTEKVFDEKNGALMAELPVDDRAMARIDAADTRLVDGPAELNSRIVESKKVQSCLATNYFRYVFRREQAGGNTVDACLLEDLTAALARPGVGLDDVFKRIALAPGFRRRKVGQP